MEVSAAQRDLRHGYMSGAPGVLASSIAWFTAAAAAWFLSPEQSVWVLFVGGMLIYPAGLLIAKLLGASANASKENPLVSLALATTLGMIFCLPLAFVASLQRIEFFFPAMLLIIGGRYLTFATLYGMRIYWVLGLGLAGAGFALGYLTMPPAVSALAGAVIELVFALVIFGLHSRWKRAEASPAGA